MNGMAKGYVGKQVKMKRSTILEKKGYLGKYADQVNLLKVGNFHSMVFSANDDGPINLSSVQRQLKKRR